MLTAFCATIEKTQPQTKYKMLSLFSANTYPLVLNHTLAAYLMHFPGQIAGARLNSGKDIALITPLSLMIISLLNKFKRYEIIQ